MVLLFAGVDVQQVMWAVGVSCCTCRVPRIHVGTVELVSRPANRTIPVSADQVTTPCILLFSWGFVTVKLQSLIED